jgi:hypothetical protein
MAPSPCPVLLYSSFPWYMILAEEEPVSCPWQDGQYLSGFLWFNHPNHPLTTSSTFLHSFRLKQLHSKPIEKVKTLTFILNLNLIFMWGFWIVIISYYLSGVSLSPPLINFWPVLIKFSSIAGKQTDKQTIILFLLIFINQSPLISQTMAHSDRFSLNVVISHKRQIGHPFRPPELAAVMDLCPRNEMSRCLCHDNKKVNFPFDVATFFVECRPKRVSCCIIGLSTHTICIRFPAQYGLQFKLYWF